MNMKNLFDFPNNMFNIPNMFNFQNKSSDSSEDSDSDTTQDRGSEDSDNIETSDDDSSTSSEEELQTTFDSVIRVSEKKYHSCFNISIDDVQKIEKTLGLSEFISIIFLLYDSSEMIQLALQEIHLMIMAGPESFSRDNLSRWARSSPADWNFKLIEALAIVQNNKVLMKLGFCQKDIKAMYDAPQYVSRIKKILYSCLCDYFKREQAQKLINNVRDDANFKQDITLNIDPKYIEFHILFWISQGYISFEREPYLNRLCHHLKGIDFEMHQKIDEEIEVWRRQSRLNINQNEDELRRRKSHRKINQDEDEIYKIRDPNNPGLLIIINNSNFERNVESRKEFQDKLPEKRLTDRQGSDEDERKMWETFHSLNYKVIVKKDVFHDDMVNVILETISSNFEEGRHSVLVLCILSHGTTRKDEGMIYGVNSVPINVQDIVVSVGSPRLLGILAGIPKVIIIQACQGGDYLFAAPSPDLQAPDGMDDRALESDGSDLRVDGRGSLSPDTIKDKVVCMATVNGFVALRGIFRGSPYIQELCKCIKLYHNKKEFVNIMRYKVNKNLAKKEHVCRQVDENRRVVMIPEIKNNTLFKKLYLSPKITTSKY